MYVIRLITDEVEERGFPTYNRLYGDCYLGKVLNSCTQNPEVKVPEYYFYHGPKFMVYFKEQWEAHMYISCYLRSDSDMYFVERRNPKENEEYEVFDRIKFKFVEPSDVQIDKINFGLSVQQAICDANCCIDQFKIIMQNIDEIKTRLRRLFGKNPEHFKATWSKSYILEPRNSAEGKKLLDDIYQMVGEDYVQKEKTI